MRKVNVLEFVSLDGVMRSPGGPEEEVLQTVHAADEFTPKCCSIVEIRLQ